MDYTQLFRQFREAKDLTLEQLAAQARVHRNTVVNIESGRPVKFKTIATLMRKMGYADASNEMRSMALLWLESVSGIPFSRPEAESAARKAIATYRSGSRQAVRDLEQAINAANLTPEHISLLAFAAANRDVLAILASIRELTLTLASHEPDKLLRAAEPPARYNEK